MDFESILEQATTGPIPGPRKIVIYGGPGIGKTTFGAMAPSPVIIQTEKGSDDVDVTRLPLCNTFTDVLNQAQAVAHGNHSWKTVVLDSADWAEKLLRSQVAAHFNESSIDEVAYGKAYGPLQNGFDQLLTTLGQCCNRGMHVVVIAHSEAVSYTNPETDSYDRWMPRLHKKLRPLLTEWATEVLFATRAAPIVVKEDLGFNKKQGRAAKEDLPRILRTNDKPFCEAKNRLNLPDELPLDWREFEKYLPAFN